VYINSSYSRSYAVKGNGTLWAWGDGKLGPLGEGGRLITDQPIQIQDVENAANIAIGLSSTTLLKTDGTVWTWGSNMFGELGNGEMGFGIGDQSKDVLRPVQLTDLNHITQISSGYSHTLALSSDGTVWAWGENSYGQLGNGNIENQPIPIVIKVNSQVESVVGSRTHSYILNRSGNVWGWGDNLNGTMGNGTFKPAANPETIGNQKDILAIRASENQIFTFSADGHIWAWGDNSYGQLGINQYDPVKLSPQVMDVFMTNSNESNGELSNSVMTDYHKIVEAGRLHVQKWLDNIEVSAPDDWDMQNTIVDVIVKTICADSSGENVTLIINIEWLNTLNNKRTRVIDEYNLEVSEEQGAWKVISQNSAKKLYQKWLDY
jgi:alpha-tubulin suppressor-like RCC1 family protein